MKTLAAFRGLVGEIKDLQDVQGLLGWDLETYMPPKGSHTRSLQLSTLAKLSHEMLISDKMGDLLGHLRDKKTYQTLDYVDQALVREVGKEYDRATKIPTRLVQEMTETTAQAHLIWVEARKTNQFNTFSPILEKIIRLNKEMADAMGYHGSPYNALMDLYEPELTTAEADELFENLKQELVPLVQAIQDSPKKPDTSFLKKKRFNANKQWDLTMRILTDMGFDFTAGRQDKSAHPFTMGMGPHDVRLTTRVFPEMLHSALFSSIHEGGHGLYEQGIDPNLARTLLDGGASLGIHESQSRMWENVVGRSRPFWTHYFPLLKKQFPSALAGVTTDRFYKAINLVQPSLIRVEADEVTYNLHILLRYEIEKALIEDQLAVKDIPDTWNTKMKAYLGVTPPTDSDGALQDVHWSHGSFGYFPTYTLGNLYSVQFFNTAKKQLPNLEGQIAKGKLLPLKQWLNEHIHRWSKVETPKEIVQRVTEEPLNAQYFMDYLWRKYGAIYHIQRPAPRKTPARA